MKPGYIYVLTHPSDPNLYKIGVTILDPKNRLSQHNRDFSKIAGRVVQKTGQRWVLKEYHFVPDPYWAEKAFWAATAFSVIPYRSGVEIERMSWGEVERGLEAAQKAGIRAEKSLKSLPNWIYAYTALMNRRLEGRDIILLGHIKSMRSGKSNFQCNNGHQWRTTPWFVAEGQGCPECGIGTRTSEEIAKMLNSGIICLLTHSANPGLIKIGAAYGDFEEFCKNNIGSEWEIHRYRNVEELPLAEKLIWELLGHPFPHNREPIEIDLRIAEEAFRKLHYAIQADIVGKEKILSV